MAIAATPVLPTISVVLIAGIPPLSSMSSSESPKRVRSLGGVNA